MTKLFAILTLTVFITGCNTVAGTVRGLGEDVKMGTDSVSNWIKPEQGNKR